MCGTLAAWLWVPLLAPLVWAVLGTELCLLQSSARKQDFISVAALPDLRLVKSPRRWPNASQNVEPLIGTGGHGHTFPGATTPWGMVQATPWAHGDDTWDSQAGFHSKPGGEVLTFYGMAHTALSGAGSGEMGELRLLPLGDQHQSSYLISGSVHGSPGYFSGLASASAPVDMPDSRACGVELEATATQRGAVHMFRFPSRYSCQGWPRRLVQVSLAESSGSFWGYKLKDHTLRGVDTHRLEGCAATQISGIGSADSYMCFVIVFDAAFVFPEPVNTSALPYDVRLEFPGTTSTLTAKVAMSRVDLEHARATLDRELAQKSFEEIRAEAEELWKSALGVVKAEIDPPSRLREFYTAMYHSMLFPSLLSEPDGAYRLQQRLANGMSGLPLRLGNVDKVLPVRYADPNRTVYATFSLWDTYRTVHPLLNLVHPQVSTEFGHSLMKMGNAWGSLPPWQLVQSPTDMMEGDGGTVVLATMARDGLLDAKDVFVVLDRIRSEAALKTRPRAKDELGETKLSALLEEARADQCAAAAARLAGEGVRAREFEERANSIFELWDEQHMVFKPRDWDPSRMDHQVDTIMLGDTYTEGTPLQYSWAAEWKLGKLIELHGGRHNFTCALDRFFNTAPEPQGSRADVTGNMHGFTQGNEPDWHTPYLFSMVGRPAKTQKVVDQLVKSMFAALPDGLPGNDDLGATSAWLALSMLGFYPADVCSTEVALGRPFVSWAALGVRGGLLQITVNDQADDNMYVRRLTWNGQELHAGRRPSGGPRQTLPWAELHKGGELVFFMTAEEPADDLHCS